ncbi:Peroxiredoxin [Sphingobacterium nematocida]|uniref:Peroxiredoxin n=1 Tax=Sphingobacterium nematocida TaxID=1513896 RepID=A0A1T5AWU3_9SPHI|nr:TlpA disulfide reductase family protein [Sphingobacterium nematocida]SKB39458.1 Peroxiredoxin [Sphingobacterium nematocida]
MKNIVWVLLLLLSWSGYAQENELGNQKLEALKNEKDKSIRVKKIKELENGSADDLQVLIQYYEKDKANKEQIGEKLRNKYPESFPAQMSRMQLFLPLSEPTDVEALVQKMMKDYPDINLDLEKNLAALNYAEVPDVEKAMQYINLMQDPVYQVYGLSLMLELIDPLDSEMALSLATKELPKVLQLKGQTQPSAALKIDPRSAYREFITAYAKLLFKAGRYEEAYPYTREAYDAMEGRDDLTLIENYAFLSGLKGQYKESLPVLSDAIKGGKYDKEYIELVKKGYSSLNPGKDADAYIAELRQVFVDKIKGEVAKLLVKEQAPDFRVTDVNGKGVSLTDFKGKTIVLDFWATWCGPCVASFPAMQLAVDRFADDQTVEFLFIHTWENVADPLTDAKNFLSKRNYNFDLYMDVKDPVTKVPPAVTAFGVTGIPAKFVIDPQGNIRVLR